MAEQEDIAQLYRGEQHITDFVSKYKDQYKDQDKLIFDVLYYIMRNNSFMYTPQCRIYACEAMIKLCGTELGKNRNRKNRCLYYILELQLDHKNQIRNKINKRLIDLFYSVLEPDMIKKMDRLSKISQRNPSHPIVCRENFYTCPSCEREVCYYNAPDPQCPGCGNFKSNPN